MPYNKTGYYKRAEQIQAIVREHYEPGRQDRCLKWVWRRHVQPLYGVCYITFLKYLKVKIPAEVDDIPKDPRQLSLFDNETPAM